MVLHVFHALPWFSLYPDLIDTVATPFCLSFFFSSSLWLFASIFGVLSRVSFSDHPLIVNLVLLVEAKDREVEGCMGFSAVCGSIGCFAGGVGAAFEVVGLAAGAAGLNTLPDLVTSAHIPVA